MLIYDNILIIYKKILDRKKNPHTERHIGSTIRTNVVREQIKVQYKYFNVIL